jgi:hypothetical protein
MLRDLCLQASRQRGLGNSAYKIMGTTDFLSCLTSSLLGGEHGRS